MKGLDILSLVAVGFNVAALTLNLRSARRFRQRIQELSNGHRQGGQNLGSVPGALPAGTPGERAGGAVTPEAAGVSPELVAQEILAVRSWYLFSEPGPFLEDQFYLVSWNATRWEGPTLRADAVPTPENAHGIYARPRNWQPSPYWMPQVSQPGMPPKVWGEIALSGRVIECESGYRAEQGTIRSLFLFGTGGRSIDLKEQLEARYGVSVVVGDKPPFEQWIYL